LESIKYDYKRPYRELENYVFILKSSLCGKKAIEDKLFRSREILNPTLINIFFIQHEKEVMNKLEFIRVRVSDINTRKEILAKTLKEISNTTGI